MSSEDDIIRTKLLTRDAEVLRARTSEPVNYNTGAEPGVLAVVGHRSSVYESIMEVLRKSETFSVTCCAAFPQVLPSDPVTELLVTHYLFYTVQYERHFLIVCLKTQNLC